MTTSGDGNNWEGVGGIFLDADNIIIIIIIIFR